MKAITIQQGTSESVLVVGEVSDPALCADSVIIKVVAAGVNRADLLQRAGKYPPPAGESEILGLEVAGVVESVGGGVSSLRLGDRVCALLAGGGYAEKVVVRAEQVFPLPEGYSFVEGAAIPEAFITAFVNLFTEAALQPGEVVLIHGGSSGVGCAAIQLAARAGARVLCTVGNDEKAKICKELGAELVVNYRTHDFREVVQQVCPQGVDVVLDIIGADYFERNLSILGTGGRLVCIATMGGAEAALNIATLMRKRARVIGSVLRSRSPKEKGEIIRAFLGRFGADLDAGVVRPVVDSTFPLAAVADAHRRMKSSAHSGKIVLTLE